MEKELEAPVRVRLVFANHHLLTKEQRSQGFSRSWAAIRPELATVADFARDISSRFGLGCNSIHGLVLSMDGFILPSFESTLVFMDNDIIRVKPKIEGKKTAVAIPDKERQIERSKIIDKQTVSSNNGILLIENGDNAIQKKKSKKKKKNKKRALTEVISTELEHKELESPEEKNKKLKMAANVRPIIINKNCSIPAIEAFCQNHTINQERNVPVTASVRNKEVNCTSQNTYSEHQGGQEFHGIDTISKEQKSMMLHKFKDKNFKTTEDFHGAIQGNGTGYLPSHSIPYQTHPLYHGAGLSNGQENGPRTNKTTVGSSPWRPRSNLDGPDAPSPCNMQKSWIQSGGPKERNSQLEINSVSTDEVEESGDEDDTDFESLYPLTCLPKEGDIIAYRLVETSSGRPELSVFRVGKVVKFDPITMLILLGPVSQYPIFPNGEISESQKSLYKEDGTLEIDFGSLVDLRVVEESESGKGFSKSKVITWENKTGSCSHSAWKTGGTSNAKKEAKTGWGTWAPSISRDGVSWQGMAQRGRNAGGMRKNVNSAWQACGPSNANGATKCQATWAMNNSRYGTSKIHWGQNGNRFGSRGSFSRGINDRAGNNNSAWEANSEATNANEPTQTQENGWDTWAPNTSRASASQSHMGQNSSGFRSGGRFSIGMRGRGGRYSNPKFSK